LRLTKRPPRPSPEVGEHRRPVDPFENEPVGSNLEYLGNREPVSTRVVHDSGLASRVPAVLEPTEHLAVA
jgi:hypothetical protein